MTLTWRAPKDDGGAEITNYIVEYRGEGAFKWVKSSKEVTEKTYTVKGLDAEVLYDFRVAAQNKAGVGEYAEHGMARLARERSGKRTNA